jgi:[acyl-carrier-protein] S-malonyltransferase
MKLGMVYPGQGSQSVGMLKGYEGLPEIDAVRAEAESAMGNDFLKIIDEGPAEQLNLTVNTQPAMVTAAIAAYRAWRALGGPAPAVVAGHSLGEYSALVAAGSIPLLVALPMVRFRARSMQEAVPEGQGAMAVILGLDDDAARAACAEAEREGNPGEAVQAVNFNAPGQVVIAGHKSAVARAIEACKARGARRAMPLPVSAPFHSSLMQPAAAKLGSYLETIVFSSPRIPVVNNVDVKEEQDPIKIKDALIRQAASPVRWVEIIRRMAAQDVTHVVECGPGRVLAGLVKRIDPKVQGIAAADRASLELALATIKGG